MVKHRSSVTLGLAQLHRDQQNRESAPLKPHIGDLVSDPSQIGAYGVILEFLNSMHIKDPSKLIAKVYWVSGRWQGEKVGISASHINLL
tara:strand:+ start:483 stop:749 length:267 start_codon:yes stop_codon:yes gene_type:complete